MLGVRHAPSTQRTFSGSQHASATRGRLGRRRRRRKSGCRRGETNLEYVQLNPISRHKALTNNCFVHLPLVIRQLSAGRTGRRKTTSEGAAGEPGCGRTWKSCSAASPTTAPAASEQMNLRSQSPAPAAPVGDRTRGRSPSPSAVSNTLHTWVRRNC